MGNSQKEPWKIKCNKYVAFLDIMGFKDMVARKPHQEIYNSLYSISEIRKGIKSEFFMGDSVHMANFSDSIIIFSKDDTNLSELNFMSVVNYIFIHTIQRHIPIKGSIAFGEISVNKSRSIFFGQPIIDAYELEEELWYYGVVFHHSAEVQMKKNNPLFPMLSEIFTLSTPLKSGNINHSNLNWFDCFCGNPYKTRENSINEMYHILNELYNGVSGKPRKYIDNTIEILSKLKSALNPTISTDNSDK